MFDVIVIGGGVIGGTILRELSKYSLKVAMVEKENDVCMGQSKANSGIVHAGFDAIPNTKKAKFNLLGNLMMPNYAKELGVKYINNGSLVLAFSDEEMEALKKLKLRGEENGVKGLEIIAYNEVLKLEKNVSKKVKGALLAKTGGIICPYNLTIASIGNAMDNGAKLFTNFQVVKIEKGEYYKLHSQNNEVIESKTIINCAGIFGGEIAKMIGDDYTIKGRKGEYILLDRESGDFVSHTLFRAPTKKGKGVLVTNTVDGNILIGPTAKEVDISTTETSREGLDEVVSKSSVMVENLPLYNTITSFSGVRAFSIEHDFIIEESCKNKGFIHCIGIESPGLTSAPAIAKHVVEELVSKNLTLNKNEKFSPYRKADSFFKHLSIKEKNEIIKKDPSYGKIVCRCEKITEGEIINAITQNPPAKDIDAIKRRTRSGMGRCQGGFCQPQILEILARELKVKVEEVTKKGKNSNIVTGVK